MEKEIEQAFKSAYTNRSDEVGDFFNKTFGPGGDADEIGRRFQTAWKGASEGVRQFVNETYWNISQTMRGENLTDPQAALEDITARVSKQIEADHDQKSSKHSKPTAVPQDGSKDKDHQSILDTAWNYFTSVFGVSTKGEPVVAGAAPLPENKPRGGLTLGLITLLAGLLLLVQAGLNRNSWINKPVETPHSRPEVPSGYVRII